MLTSVTVKNFRNLRSVTLEKLGRFTLIGGKNGVGKTALLEALWLLSGPDIPELGQRINSFRGLPSLGSDNIFKDIFRDFDTESRISISARGDWGNLPRKLEVYLQERRKADSIHSDISEISGIERATRPQNEGEFELVFKYHHNNNRDYISRAWWIAEQLTPVGPGPTLTTEGIRQERQVIQNRADSLFISALHREDIQTVATRLGQLQLEGEDDRILSLITLLEPRVKRLNTITIKNTPVIHAYMEGVKRPIPVHLLGEGFNRMLGLALAMKEATDGLILIDELENGLHHSVHGKVFSTLLNLAKEFNVQIFATTHSSECIRAAYHALAGQSSQDEDEFIYHRLDRVDGGIKLGSFDKEMLETAKKFNMEIR